MLHLFIRTLSHENVTEIDVEPQKAVINILNFIDNPKKSWQANSKILFIYDERILSHYLSFSFQQVKNNSTINVTVVQQLPLHCNNFQQKSNRFISIADQFRQKYLKFDRTSSSVDCEICRLSDLSFTHLELSSFYSNFYNIQNLIQDQEKNQIMFDEKTGNNNELRNEPSINFGKLFLTDMKNGVPYKLNPPPISKNESISEEPLPPCFNFSFL